MSELPSTTLALFDGGGQAIGFLRLAKRTGDVIKGECIFDVREPPADARSEARWLYKRRYQRMSEHRFAVDDEGVLKVTGPDFKVLFEPNDEGGLTSRPPAPRVRASWVTTA
jgi:hypothetical protein